MTASPTSPPRILAIAGSLRAGSYNKRLLAVGVSALSAGGAEVDVVDLRALGFPPYDGDIEANEGVPAAVHALRARIVAAQGLLIASPEYNHSIPGTFKNVIDWASRPPKPYVFHDKVVGLMGASPGGFGAMRALLHLREVFAALGAWVLPAQVTISRADSAFTPDGTLADPKRTHLVQQLAADLIANTGRHASQPRN